MAGPAGLTQESGDDAALHTCRALIGWILRAVTEEAIAKPSRNSSPVAFPDAGLGQMHSDPSCITLSRRDALMKQSGF